MPIWTRQKSKPWSGARIDGTHPLAAGLVAAWPFTEGSGLIADVVSGRQASSNSGDWGSSPSGAAITYASGKQTVVGAETGWLDFTTPITLAVLANPSASVTGEAVLGFHDNAGSAGCALGIAVGGVAGRLSYFTSGGWTDSADGAVDGDWHLYAVNAANPLAFYRDGVPMGGSGDGTPVGSYAGERLIGATASGRIYTRSVALALVWNRALTADEHLGIGPDPWQLFAPQRSSWFTNPAASGGVFPFFADQSHSGGFWDGGY
jgi:hypothetical protein